MGKRRPWGGFSIAAIGAASIVTAGAGVLGPDGAGEEGPPPPPLSEPAPGALVEVAEPAEPVAEAAEASTGAPALPEPVPSNQPQLFPVPRSLEPAVAFWTDVFTRYRSHQVVLHDHDDLAAVWRVIDLPLDANGEVDRNAARKITREAVQDLTRRLSRLTRTGRPRDDFDHALLRVCGTAYIACDQDGVPEAGAAGRVRSQRGIAERFEAGLVRARHWLPQIHAILEENDVPKQLRALPLIESAYNPGARSSAGAAGLWQLMPATARQLGLEVGGTKDERLDVLASTRAAARMLRTNHKMLSTWPLAITGYNHGPNGMKRAVQAVGSTDIELLIQRHDGETWGFASKNFYAEFIAALRIVEGIERNEIAANTTETPASVLPSAVD